MLFALAISTWWFQRVAFSPSADADATKAILSDDNIRAEVATVIASADAPELGQSPTQLKEFIEQIAAHPDGPALMTGFVSGAHARLIGELDEPVRISAAEQVTIVRDELVANMPPITLIVQEVSALSTIDEAASWIALVALALGGLTAIAGIVIRPERGELTLALAVGLGSLALLLIVLGYLVPMAVLPSLSDNTWMGVFPRLANHNRGLTLGVAGGAVVLGAAIMLGTGSLRQRRQFSTPLSVGRYREQHSWSR